jgi:hypothetical protein
MMVLYCMICFSPFVPDPIARYKMGFFCCFILREFLPIFGWLICYRDLGQIAVERRTFCSWQQPGTFVSWLLFLAVLVIN